MLDKTDSILNNVKLLKKKKTVNVKEKLPFDKYICNISDNQKLHTALN